MRWWGGTARALPTVLEHYSLAESAEAFWRGAALPGALVAAHEARFSEFLQRAMQVAAPLASPADLAWFLASYAREALARLEGRPLTALAPVRAAMEEALGIRFEGERGEHFFHSTLVQTLFYGIFSAWVLWSHDPHRQGERFDWRLSPWLLHVPMIRALFEQVSMPSRVQSLGMVEVLERAGETLNRVEREAFFATFEEAQAVQYFYEPFLEQFDPALRRQLGVWYTPPEIVRYMVARVDQTLREQLGVAEGLADPQRAGAGPGLRHRGLSGGGAAPHCGAARGGGGGAAAGRGAEAGGAQPPLRL